MQQFWFFIINQSEYNETLWNLDTISPSGVVMFSIGRDSDEEFLEVSDTLMSVKNYIEETRHDSDSHNRKRTYKQDRLKQIFINAKKNRIKDAFIQKLTRGIDSDDLTMINLWKEQLIISKSPIQGFIYREELQNALQILNLIVFPILVILTCFCGFLDQFNDNYASHPVIIILQIFCLAITGFRFIIKCTSMTFSEGQFKRYMKDIALSYLKTNRLVFDLIMLIFQVIFVLFPHSMVIPGLFFFYLNLNTIYPGNDVTKAESAYIQSKRMSLLWGLFKIIYFNVFFAHFMGTVILAMSRIEPQNNWMVRLGIAEEVWYVKYVYAYYWGTTIMMTVGFGDVLPGLHNWRQVIVTCFLQMFSCVVLGYNISAIGSIVSKLREADDIVNRKIIIFQRMMHNNRKREVKINPLLQRRILNYLQELRIDKGNLQYIQRDQFLSSLPQNLRKSYYKDANKRIFPKVLFFNRLKPQTQQIMAEKFKSSFYNHGQYLSNNQESKFLILQNGKVGLAYNKRGSSINGQVLQTLEVQQGEQSLLLNAKQFLTLFPQNKYLLISKSSCMVWSIKYEQFLETLNKSLIDIQYYFSIIHKHPIDQDQWDFIQCQRCTNGQYKRYHTIFDCSKATKMPIRSMVSFSYAAGHFNQNQQRINIKRKKYQLPRRSALSWKEEHQKDFQKIKTSQTYQKKKTNLVNKKLHSNSINIAVTRLGEQLVATQSEDQQLRDQKLKKLILQVLKQHQTGYQDDFWFLECDAAHDYQFYFPQDNINRFWDTPINVHPRFFHKKEFKNFANRIRTLHHT